MDQDMDEDIENFYGDESLVKDDSEVASSVTLKAEPTEESVKTQEVFTLPGLGQSDYDQDNVPTKTSDAQSPANDEVAQLLTSLLDGLSAPKIDEDDRVSGDCQAQSVQPSVTDISPYVDNPVRVHHEDTLDAQGTSLLNVEAKAKLGPASLAGVATFASTEALDVSLAKANPNPQHHSNLSGPGDAVSPGYTNNISREPAAPISEDRNEIKQINVSAPSIQVGQTLQASAEGGAGDELENAQDTIVNGTQDTGTDAATHPPPEDQAEFEYDSSPYQSSSDDSDDCSDSSNEDSDDSDGEDYEMLDPIEQARRLMEADDGSDDEGGGKNGATRQLRTVNEKPEEIIEIPNIEVTLDMKIEELGQVERSLDNVILIKAKITGEYQVLESGSLLCLEDRKVIGVVSETLGRVQQPLYCVRFTNEESIAQVGVQQGTTIFYVPQCSEFVFTKSIQGLKGSDASNLHDEEIGDDEKEFSDDEAEAKHKREKKERRRGNRGGRDSLHPFGNRGNSTHRPIEDVVTLTYEDGNAEDLYTPLARPASLNETQRSSTLMGEYPQESYSRGQRGSRGPRGRGYRGRGMGRGRGRGFSNGTPVYDPSRDSSSPSTSDFTVTAQQSQPQFQQGPPPFNPSQSSFHHGQPRFNQQHFQFNGVQSQFNQGQPQFAANFQAPYPHQPNPQHQRYKYGNHYPPNYHGQPTGQYLPPNNGYSAPYQQWQQMGNIAQAQPAPHPLPTQYPPSKGQNNMSQNNKGIPLGGFNYPDSFQGHFPNNSG